ncbi:MAG: hypothetical protein H5T66_04255 [Chloroflexi bacterium]|nr:hypothetical protein [Chloroflexota bacterium]
MTLPTLLIVLAPFVLILMILGFITLNRYIAYKERVALAQLGFSMEDIAQREAAQRRGSRGVLWGGVITAMSGLALLLGLSTLGVGAWLIGGLLPLFVGLGIILIYFMTSGPAPRREEALADAPSGDPEAQKGERDEDGECPTP